MHFGNTIKEGTRQRGEGRKERKEGEKRSDRGKEDRRAECGPLMLLLCVFFCFKHVMSELH